MRTVQLRPSALVMIRLPVPLLETATRSFGGQDTASQLLSAAKRTVDQSTPQLPPRVLKNKGPNCGGLACANRTHAGEFADAFHIAAHQLQPSAASS